MNLCIVSGLVMWHFASAGFTLSWVHSVEKTEWRETWRVEDAGLRLVEARVRGSGAGMDPGEGARLQDGWWVWEPDLPPQPEIRLAASGATGGGWTVCPDGAPCETFGVRPGTPIEIYPCASNRGGDVDDSTPAR